MPTHDHGHEHGPPGGPDRDTGSGHFQLLELALYALLVEKGIFSAADVQREIEIMEGRLPERGSLLVARAWTDPVFKARLLDDGRMAAEELGFTQGPDELMVVENTERLHNLIVCTLCSCYPRRLLGLPPAWYKSLAYRSRAVREPRAVLAEFGTVVPSDVEVRVHDSTADLRYMVLPLRPAGTEGWSARDLAALVTRDALIGVRRALSPADRWLPHPESHRG